jgi:hypothetical protein
MSFDKIHQLVNSLAKELDNSQKLATPFLASKLSKYAALYPQDKTLGSMSRIITDMVDHNKMFICKSDLKSLYHQMHSYGTHFAELFQTELGEAPPEPTVTFAKTASPKEIDQYSSADQVLVNALESVFDKNVPLKMYSKKLADKALKSVATTFDAWNMSPTQLAVVEGNDRFLVIKADYETPKGVTSLYVPVEVAKNDVIDPEIFMGNKGPQPLDNANIKAYVTQQAGVKNKIAAKDILNVLVTAAAEKRDISSAEMAVIRLNAARKNDTEFAANQVGSFETFAAPKPDVQLPKHDEFESFEKQFTTPKGVAAWQFGAETVALGRTSLARELTSYGFTSPQIVVTGSDKDTIFYGVSLDTGKAAFVVPIKIADGKKLMAPTVLLCNGSLASFDRTSINELVSTNKKDTKIAAVASTMASLKPSEILNNLRDALAEGNLPKAEDALNVLAKSGDEKAYATAFAIYMQGLAGITKTASTECSRMIKSAVSEYPICSHTGLPINKVYQDKDGNCRPLYRKGMDETYEGASFMNAKIFG